MFDLLAARGIKKILEFLEKNPKQKVSEIQNYLLTLPNEDESKLTTATLYRRIKELEVAGFIVRDPPGSKTFILSSKAKTILEERERLRPVLAQLKRPYRALLHQLDKKEVLNVQQLYKESQLSPNTAIQGLEELQDLGLVEQISIHSLSSKKEVRSQKVGRPAKMHRITEKGKRVYKTLRKLEEEQTK
jgi:DNA-binding IclR family transcriptional regulator